MNTKGIENEGLFRISHEIRNSLSVVKGYMSLFDGNIEKYNEYMPLVRNAVNHSLAILEDFSCIGELKYEEDIMDINYLLDEIVSYYKPILASEDIELVYKQNKDEVFVYGDYKRLREVFVNIIKNSKESLDNIDNPMITISSKVINNKVVIKCNDNGCGMDEYILSRLSEPFFTTKQNGTGLGVYISKEIINAHKGEIIYESDKNVGTCVNIKLSLSTGERLRPLGK